MEDLIEWLTAQLKGRPREGFRMPARREGSTW